MAFFFNDFYKLKISAAENIDHNYSLKLHV